MDANWWLEPDVEGRVFGAPHDSENDNMIQGFYRARLLCYLECPLLMACREAGRQELHHVWGGLLPRERRRERETGRTATFTPTEIVTPVMQMPGKWRQVAELIMAGRTAAEIAEEMGISRKSARTYMAQLMRAVRENRERQEGWRTPPPPHPVATPTSFRRGREVSPRSQRESA